MEEGKRLRPFIQGLLLLGIHFNRSHSSPKLLDLFLDAFKVNLKKLL